METVFFLGGGVGVLSSSFLRVSGFCFVFVFALFVCFVLSVFVFVFCFLCSVFCFVFLCRVVMSCCFGKFINLFIFLLVLWL